MEKWMAIRDAFFWWAGVWATVTAVNHAIFPAIRRYRREIRGEAQFYDQMADKSPIGAADKPDTEETPDGAPENP